MVDVKALAQQVRDEVIAWRRDFHRYPEVSLQEYRTAEVIEKELRNIGLEPRRCGETGVIATLTGAREGRTVGLRADMDALSLEEENHVPYASENKGVMHACGHDAHVAVLLGAAKILTGLREELAGKVKFFFQAAEESAQGAKIMVEAGEMEDVDVVASIHVWADMPAGKFSVEPGPRMAAADQFKITITGKGGHAAAPHQTIDSVVAASAFVMNLQTIVSREVSPTDSLVVTVGKIEAGSRWNIIANQAVLEGTVRGFCPELQGRAPEMIERILKGTADVYRAKGEMEYVRLVPVTLNTPHVTELGAEVVKKLYGEDSLVHLPKMTGGEDFAYFLEKAPGFMAFLGVGNKDKACFPHHHPKFDIDEEALEQGVAFFVQFVWDYLALKR